MAPDDASVLQILRGGAAPPGFAAARDDYLRRHAPDPNQRIQAAVHGPVQIIRDPRRRPAHLRRDSRDLFFGLGVAMAQDRLWQMDRLRRRALGRQAEILGAAYLASDIAHLTVGIPADRGPRSRRDRPANPHPRRSPRRRHQPPDRGLRPRRSRSNSASWTTGRAPSPSRLIAIGRGIWWSLNGRIDRIAAAEAATLLPERCASST